MKISLNILAIILFCQVGFAQEKPKKAENQNKVEEVNITEIHESFIEGDISIGVEAPRYDEEGYQDPNRIYIAAEVQVMPEYPGGVSRLQEDILENINPADNDAPEGIKLKVYVSFIVEKDGSVTNVKILRDPGYGFAKEVLSAIKKLKKKWNPGIQNGSPVRVQYSLPVEIKVP